jgi:hypothetical protein
MNWWSRGKCAKGCDCTTGGAKGVLEGASLCNKGDFPLSDIGIVVVAVIVLEDGGALDQPDGCTDKWMMRCSSAV